MTTNSRTALIMRLNVHHSITLPFKAGQVEAGLKNPALKQRSSLQTHLLSTAISFPPHWPSRTGRTMWLHAGRRTRFPTGQKWSGAPVLLVISRGKNDSNFQLTRFACHRYYLCTSICPHAVISETPNLLVVERPSILGGSAQYFCQI